MKSKTKIERQMQKKTSTELVNTIIAAKKNENWARVAEILSGPRKNRINLNLEEINKKVEEEKIIVIPGKVLSQGSVNKKIKIIALNFSDKAKEKLLKSNCEVSSIVEEIKKNPGADKVYFILTRPPKRGRTNEKEIKILENAKSKDFTLSKTKEVFNK